MTWKRLRPRLLMPIFPHLEISAVIRWSHGCCNQSYNPQSHLHLITFEESVMWLFLEISFKGKLVPMSFSSLPFLHLLPGRFYDGYHLGSDGGGHTAGMAEWGAVRSPGPWNFIEQNQQRRYHPLTSGLSHNRENTLIVPTSLLFTIIIIAEHHFKINIELSTLSSSDAYGRNANMWCKFKFSGGRWQGLRIVQTRNLVICVWQWKHLVQIDLTLPWKLYHLLREIVAWREKVRQIQNLAMTWMFLLL